MFLESGTQVVQGALSSLLKPRHIKANMKMLDITGLDIYLTLLLSQSNLVYEGLRSGLSSFPRFTIQINFIIQSKGNLCQALTIKIYTHATVITNLTIRTQIQINSTISAPKAHMLGLHSFTAELGLFYGIIVHTS